MPFNEPCALVDVEEIMKGEGEEEVKLN